jgi:predicted phosphodiesterase
VNRYYQDKEIEDVEFVEVIVSSGDYTLKGASSARVAIRDSHLEILAGDMDNTNGINLKDAIIALQVCAGKDVSSVYVESSIGKDRIGIKEVLYILNEIAGK